jgi:non-lysosomal glucosylceramidase
MEPSHSPDRRRFLKLSSASAIAATFGGTRAGAQDTSAALYARVVPAVKNLGRDWLASLVTPGHPLDAAIRAAKKDTDPTKIGMTVGGIGCGTVYLCGDGRLFIWDILNQPHEGVVAQKAPLPAGLENIAGGGKTARERDGSNYLNPPTPDSFPNPFRQHFGIRTGDKTRRFQSADWNDISFDGKWPLGEVRYADPACPLKVTLRAWTPFVPLDLDKSSLPVTVMEFTLRNDGAESVGTALEGVLENPCLLFSKRKADAATATRLHRAGKLTLLSHAATQADMQAAEDSGSMVLGLLDREAASDGRETLSTTVNVAPGTEETVVFLLCWHFPNLHPLPNLGKRKRHYDARFTSAEDAAIRIARDLPTLRSDTFKWVSTWYDSSLPRWILDRAAATTNTLQTANCIIFDDGRFWAWEGIGCCPGTCGHVWHYAQGPARLFPEIERNLRLVTDFGVAQNPDGAIRFRAEAAGNIAIDSQTGAVLRTWREHQCSADDGFLRKAWPGAKKATAWLLEFDRKDPDGLDGLLHGEQHNTLDAEWYGKVHALCSLYLASLRAAAEMAIVMDDADFADRCREAFESGFEKISILFNGEFYIQQEDPAHATAIGVGAGCYIDQVIGQWWAHQTGLGRICAGDEVKSALHSLWRYNFVPDVGPFRNEFRRGRFYAMPGEAGLVMCTWPKGGLRPDFVKHWQYAYFNECMSGFEWQVAAHMIHEGEALSAKDDPALIENPDDPRSLTLRGLAIARAIHDRYSPKLRNPYNEIECSDHYARAAASYSMLVALSGFTHNGPRGLIGFDPKLEPAAFKCPFTAAEGWGTYSQTLANGVWTAVIAIAHGSLRVFDIHLPWLTPDATATLDGAALAIKSQPGFATIPGEGLRIRAGSRVELRAKAIL